MDACFLIQSPRCRRGSGRWCSQAQSVAPRLVGVDRSHAGYWTAAEEGARVGSNRVAPASSLPPPLRATELGRSPAQLLSLGTEVPARRSGKPWKDRRRSRSGVVAVLCLVASCRAVSFRFAARAGAAVDWQLSRKELRSAGSEFGRGGRWDGGQFEAYY